MFCGMASLAITSALWFTAIKWVGGLYLLYLGLPITMRAPKDKAVIYLVAIIVASIVLWIGVAMIAGILGMAGLMMRG